MMQFVSSVKLINLTQWRGDAWPDWSSWLAHASWLAPTRAPTGTEGLRMGDARPWTSRGREMAMLRQGPRGPARHRSMASDPKRPLRPFAGSVTLYRIYQLDRGKFSAGNLVTALFGPAECEGVPADWCVH